MIYKILKEFRGGGYGPHGPPSDTALLRYNMGVGQHVLNVMVIISPYRCLKGSNKNKSPKIQVV